MILQMGLAVKCGGTLSTWKSAGTAMDGRGVAHQTSTLPKRPPTGATHMRALPMVDRPDVGGQIKCEGEGRPAQGAYVEVTPPTARASTS